MCAVHQVVAIRASRRLHSIPLDSRPNATSTESNTPSSPANASTRRFQSAGSGGTGSTVTILTRAPRAASRFARLNLPM